MCWGGERWAANFNSNSHTKCHSHHCYQWLCYSNIVHSKLQIQFKGPTLYETLKAQGILYQLHTWRQLWGQGSFIIWFRSMYSWVFIVRADAEAETPILWSPDAKNQLIWKDPDAGKDWRQKEKGTTEDEMVGRHHRLNGHGFGWTPGVGDGQGGLTCCGSWGCKELDMSERLNWTESPPNF